ncbi:acyl-ACP--UDP-N-acetylglucosamine O-acyltransferase [Acanthopleuribacter pedis]|uniref:Acyl-[acyl-carrier-protein]--UDP-N-acetylglucosamine O-acyltransferase n=1 Tax=Acanthopleuribacter pedis TaxID=442870 RepID=A0A8J7U6L2_9BACT|nr:acyl-ACP--UDP-N-acetylglucosamine O-acyltransferase [Acanthopleuribacter pedis]MBO1320496.1 acyl-ACP--UDP-N-acetylglucosamine O-acyltransferase [Acanthopleuribacter pedis]
MAEFQVHPTAIVGNNVTIGAGTEIGPYCVIEDDVTIGENNILGSHLVIGRYTNIGNHNRFYPFSTIGLQPQDLKFDDEKTVLEIGDHNTFREHVTLHRGTGHGGGVTRIGSHNLVMVSAHVAHDCLVGDHVILSHAATLAGHVLVGNHATVGAYSGVHQFCRVGDYAFIGGYSVITQDALPYIKSVGNRAKAYGINTIGLERKGFTKEEITNLKDAYRTLFQRKLRLVEAQEVVTKKYSDCARVKYLLDFIAASERGIVRM